MGYAAVRYEPRAQQPQDPVRIRREFLPIGGINPGFARGTALVDVTGAPLTIGTGFTRAVTKDGIAIDGTTSNTGITASISDFIVHPISGLFVAGARTLTGNMCLGSLATAVDKTVRIFTNSSGGCFAQHIGATTNASATTAQAWTFGGWFWVLGVFASQTDVRCYCVGDFARPVPAASTTDVGAMSPLTKMAFGIYDGSVKTTQFDGRINLGLWMKRSFTAREAHELMLNPWQVFEPIERRIWVPTVAAGAAVGGYWNQMIGQQQIGA